MSIDRLTCRKSDFSLPDGLHYLNCAYMSPLPRSVEEAGIRALARKRAPHEITPSDFFDDSDRVRRLFAELIGAAEPSRVALIPAVSYPLSMIGRNTVVPASANIVVVAEQFPSNIYPWRRVASECGATMRTVDAPESASRGEAWNEAILAAIDSDTALVALPQVHWTDGTVFDLEAVGGACRAVGAAFVIDATQSVGAYPFDVQAIGADAVVCAGYKWLLGSYGMGVAWIGPRYADATPLEDTWIGRAGSEDFRGLVNYRDDYQPGAGRFDVGERSSFVLVPMLARGLELVNEWGPARIQAYCRELVAETIEDARTLGFRAESPAWRASHLFGLRAPDGLDIAQLQEALAGRGVRVSLRGSAVRISPYLYNDQDDMAALSEGLRSAVSARV